MSIWLYKHYKLSADYIKMLARAMRTVVMPEIKRDKPRVTIGDKGTLRVKSSDVLSSTKSSTDLAFAREIVGHRPARKK